MSKVTHIQNSLTGGEFSPRLGGRQDLEKYATGAERLENFITLPHGGITRRPGTRFVAEAKHHDKACRLIPFEFSADQTYVLEFGDGYIRFFADEGQIFGHAMSSPYEIVSPYAEADLPSLAWAQSADVLYIVHRDHPPMKLARRGHTDWSIDAVVFVDGPYMDENKDSTATITPGATGEIIVNGGFPTDLKGWFDVSDVGSSVEWDASGWANLISDGVGHSRIQQGFPASGGVELALSFKVESGPLNLEILTGSQNDPTNLCTGGTATAETSKPGHAPENATDGTNDTSWAPVTGSYYTVGTTWWQYVFTERKIFNKIKFVQSPDGWVKSIIVHKWDGYTWSKAQQFDNLSSGANTLELDSALNSDRFRIVLNSMIQGPETAWITEIEAYDISWTFDETPLVASTSYATGTHNVTFTPEANCTAYLRFGHNSDASRAIDDVSIPTLEEYVTLSASKDVFDALQVGGYFRLLQGDVTGYCKIVEVIDARTATAEIKTPFGSTESTTKWREGAWSGLRGFPAAVTFHENRLWFGGSADQPQTVWGSASSDYENFTPGADDADPVTVELSSTQINSIRWMRSGRVLLVGTIGGEWRMGSVSTDTPLTPANAFARQESTYGSAAIAPIQVGGVVLFVQRSGRKLREMAYDYNNDGWVSPDLSILAEHITSSGIKEMAYAQEPDSILWCVRNDGALIGFTYNRAEQVVGWHRHPMAGKVLTACTVTAGEYDQLWIVVERTIGGVPKRYVEFLTRVFDDQGQADAIFLDSSLSYEGTPVSTISGLDHLEGQTVRILGDGAVMPPRLVTAGSVTLPAPCSKIHAGLHYDSILKPLRIEAGGDDGTAQAHVKRVVRVAVRLLRSIGLRIGQDETKLQDVAFRLPSDSMGSPPALFSGDKTVITGLPYSREGQFVIVQDTPLPMTILAIIYELQTNGM